MENTENILKKRIIIFFDCEFSGLHKNTTLISIGLTSSDGKSFYAELNDYDKSQIDIWLENNIISKLLFNDDETIEFYDDSFDNRVGKCDLKTLEIELRTWLEQFEEIEIWSDCLSYDWVLFNDIFGHAFKLPKNIYYIPFDICTLFKIKNIDPDISREEFSESKETRDKHNALFDAQIIKKCYYKLLNLN